MKKTIFIWLILFIGLSYQSVAKAGMAYDEQEFVWAIVAFLLLLAGIFKGIDYLKKNGKGLFIKFRTFLKKKILFFMNSHRSSNQLVSNHL